MLQRLKVFGAFLGIIFLTTILLVGCQGKRPDKPDPITISEEETAFSLSQKVDPTPIVSREEEKLSKEKQTESLVQAASKSISKRDETVSGSFNGQESPSETILAPSKEKKIREEQYVLFSITGDPDKGTILPPTEVSIAKEDTVLSLLIRLTKERKIPLDYRGTGAMAYVEGIDNLYEFDKGPQSGWLYRVNGEIPAVGVGAFKLEAGDTVEYIYTQDLGKDAGEPLT